MRINGSHNNHRTLLCKLQTLQSVLSDNKLAISLILQSVAFYSYVRTCRRVAVLCPSNYLTHIKLYSHQLKHFSIQPRISLLSYIKIT